jgi:TonB family protein
MGAGLADVDAVKKQARAQTKWAVRLGVAWLCGGVPGPLCGCATARAADAPAASVPTATPPAATAPPTEPAAAAAPADRPPLPAAPSTPAPALTDHAFSGITIIGHPRPRPPGPKPVIRLAEPTVGPDPPLPLPVITRVFQISVVVPLTDCYRRALALAPELTGIAEVQLQIAADGAVAGAEVTRSLTPTVDGCLLTAVRTARFPQPRGGAVTVRYPFRFLPTR